MTGPVRQIVAFGGGGFSMEPGNPLLDSYVLDVARRRRRRPRVCFLPTASGDADHYVVRFYRSFAGRECETSHVSLFRRDEGASDFHSHLLDQDLIYVGGGSVLSLLGAWRAHGVDCTLRRAWESGVILCGLSAGSLCWFEDGVTAFHGEARPVHGLGLLPYSNCVHFDGESTRERAYRKLLSLGMAPGYAVGDGTALHFRGRDLHRAVASRPGGRAYRMECVDGDVESTALEVAYLGAGPDVGEDDAPAPALAAA